MIKKHFYIIISLAAALGAVGATFESWIGFPLWLRLAVIAVIGIFIFWSIASRFLPTIPKQTVGIRPRTADRADPPKKKWNFAMLVFFMISCALVGLAWLSTERLAVVATSEKRDDLVYLKLEAANVASDVRVNLRRGCDYSERSARVIRINETRSNEQILITDFDRGQLVEISCSSDRVFDARDIEISKGDASLIFAKEQTMLRASIGLGGFILWAFGLLRLRAL